ncbi:lysM domain-containing GPI-anchored protein 1-like [Rosa rugosa]|uniref:lysM domain-containing GPI-anchored protein 1-like n=1 Tax=Rosa rugosa TaxID=74645 RepID=UPI002B405654|nr:lysM domain-containing GPI-anchored protein 1-like [Rosa rugosa]
MRNQLLLQLPFVLILIFIVSSKLTHAKSTIEPCTSSDSCPSLLSYVLPWDSKLSEIAYRFQVNVFDIMAANSINVTTSSVGNQIFGARSQLKVPISCPCVDGIRRVLLSYMVQAADSLDLISEGYGRLVSGEQLRTLNGISPKNPLTSGQSILVQLPCTCFNNSNNGVTSVFMSYVVQSGESLSNIGVEFGTTVMELVNVNGLDQPRVDPGDILAIPISACSSANLNWYNESLIVPNGSYALTASNCIKCICRPSTLNLQCFPSGIVNACSHLQCKGSNIFIGDVSINRTATGCNISTCVYRGHNGGKIFRGLVNSSHSHCSDDDYYSTVSPVASPNNPTVPYISLPPSQSPFPNPTIGTGANGPSSIQNPNSAPNKYGRWLTQAPYYSLWVVLCFFL